MVPNPEPLESIRTLPGQRSAVKPDPGRIEHADLLEPDRRMPRINLEQRKALVRKLADGFRKLPITRPEIGVGKVIQRRVQLPAS